MISISVKQPSNKQNFEHAMGLFKREVKKDGFLNKLKEHRYFMTNAEKAKLKRIKARKNRRKK